MASQISYFLLLLSNYFSLFQPLFINLNSTLLFKSFDQENAGNKRIIFNKNKYH